MELYGVLAVYSYSEGVTRQQKPQSNLTQPRTTLETYGYRVILAIDGAEAIALYTQNREQLRVVLMDMVMPIMDGLAAIRALHKIDPQVKVIAVSGLKENDRLAEVTGTDVCAFLMKPYTAETLLKTLHKVLSTS